MTTLVQFRPATDDDKPFVDALLFDTMHGYVEATWPDNEEARRHYYAINSFKAAGTRIIQADGKDVGRLSTTLFRGQYIFIDELHILPKYHQRSIGRQAIEQVFAEAREENLLVRATILKVNYPSQLLCFAMGFRVFDFKDHRFHIEYEPIAAR